MSEVFDVTGFPWLPVSAYPHLRAPLRCLSDGKSHWTPITQKDSGLVGFVDIDLGLIARYAIKDVGNNLGTLARLALQLAWEQLPELERHLHWCNERIAAQLKTNDQVR
jgi:hypothetical protein